MVAELDTSHSALRTYGWLGKGGGLLWVKDHGSGAFHVPGYDGNGNITRLINYTDRTVSAEYEYAPYGGLLRATGPMAQAMPFRFSSEYQDDVTGLVYYGHRYYSPQTRRWLSPDPIGYEGGLNLYGFVGNDPINEWDWLGLDPQLPCNGENGLWISGTPGDGAYVHNKIFEKYGKSVTYAGGQPDFKPFANGQVVDVPKQYVFTGDYKDIEFAETEMLKKDPNWKKQKDYAWHHFENPATGKRELQYVPSIVNSSLKHKNTPVANARTTKKAAREAANNVIDCSKSGKGRLVATITMMGLASTVAGFAQSHQAEYHTLNKNVPSYFQALEKGEPTYEYSVEIATAYATIFQNQVYFYAILVSLENKESPKQAAP